MSPYIFLQDQARISTIDDNSLIPDGTMFRNLRKERSPAKSSFNEFIAYTNELLTQPRQNLSGLLSPADTLEDALNKAVHSLQDDFPVIRDSDMVGVISKQHILRALREEGNGYVQSAMKKAFESAGRNDTLAGAFRKITKGVTMIPIVDENRLVGIVTLQNLMHSMGVLAESRKLSRAQEEEE